MREGERGGVRQGEREREGEKEREIERQGERGGESSSLGSCDGSIWKPCRIEQRPMLCSLFLVLSEPCVHGPRQSALVN